MNDDCDGELAVLAETVAIYSQETKSKYSEEGEAGEFGVSGGAGVARAAAAMSAVTDRDVVGGAGVARAAAAIAAATGRDVPDVVVLEVKARGSVPNLEVSQDTRDLIDAAASLFRSADTSEAAAAAHVSAQAPSRDGTIESLSSLSGSAVHAAHAAVDAEVEAPAAGTAGTTGTAGTAGTAGTTGAREVPAVSRKVTAKPRVRTRRTRPRSKTIAMKRLTRAELHRGALAHPPVEDAERPATRAECKDGPRPCPWVACKHHLYLDINPRTGSIKINFPDLEPWELQHTCALDVADNGGLTLEEIGLITNLTRERVRQVEVRGLLTLKSRSNSLR